MCCMKKITRSKAIKLGLVRYYTGVPCRNGHISERMVRAWKCLQCKREKYKRWKKRHPDKYRQMLEKKMEKTKRLSRYRWFRDRRALYAKEYAQRNREKVKEKKRKYKKTISFRLERKRARFNRRAKIKGTFNSDDILILLYKQQHRCAICKEKGIRKGYDIDHKVALCNGGANSPDNLQLVCRKCHIEKSKKDYLIWKKRRKR